MSRSSRRSTRRSQKTRHFQYKIMKTRVMRTQKAATGKGQTPSFVGKNHASGSTGQLHDMAVQPGICRNRYPNRSLQRGGTIHGQ